MKNQSRIEQNGFTLVELLVAITILAMVMAAVTGSVHVSTRLTSNVMERAHTADRQVQIRTFLRRQLRQASVTKVTGSDGREQIAFSGTSRRLNFVAPLPESSAISGLHQLTLQVEENDGDQNLILLHRPFLPHLRTGGQDTEGGREVLLEGMGLIEFSYFYNDPTGGYWSEEWTNPVLIPALIRIRFGSRDRKQWPQLLVAPRIDPQQPLFLTQSSR
jgi:general secretion pathway protein J